MDFALGPAKRKVDQPWNWFWTKILLEQASDQWVAEQTAEDFPKGIQVVDGCCGAGVDSIALAQYLKPSSESSETVLPIDASGLACQLTRWNARQNGLVLNPRHARFEEFDLPAQAWLHLDPDRRASGRTVDVYATEPSWTTIAARIDQAKGAHRMPDDGYLGTERFDSNDSIGESPDGKMQRGSQADFAKQAVGIMKFSMRRSSMTPSGISEFSMNALKSKSDPMSLTMIPP